MKNQELKKIVCEEIRRVLKELKMTRTETIIKHLKEDTEYQKFFQMAMKKFNINTPDELKDPTKKKEFFDYVDKNYKAKEEMNEGAINANSAQKIHKDLTSFLKSKIIKEEYAVDFKYMKPFTLDIRQAIKTLQVLNDKIETAGPLSEDIVDAVESLEGLYDKIKKAR